MRIKWVDNFVLNWIYFKYAVLVEWKHSQINEQDNIEKFKKKALPVRAYDEKFANTKCCHLILRHTLGEILQCTLNKICSSWVSLYEYNIAHVFQKIEDMP
jgi:hypothetical protein